jgi:hypothetical protein
MAGVQVDIIFHSTALAWAMAIPVRKATNTKLMNNVPKTFFIFDLLLSYFLIRTGLATLPKIH